MTDIIREKKHYETSPDGLKADSGNEAVSVGGEEKLGKTRF